MLTEILKYILPGLGVGGIIYFILQRVRQQGRDQEKRDIQRKAQEAELLFGRLQRDLDTQQKDQVQKARENLNRVIEQTKLRTPEANIEHLRELIKEAEEVRRNLVLKM